jgi:hypothetical protein
VPGEFTVLGIGADPRIYGYRPVSSPATCESAYQFISQPDQPDWFLALLFDGDLFG